MDGGSFLPQPFFFIKLPLPCLKLPERRMLTGTTDKILSYYSFILFTYLFI